MEDSDDDDIVVVKEVIPQKFKSWKWKAPNPALKVGEPQKILQQVREKLNMKNPAEVLVPEEDKRLDKLSVAGVQNISQGSNKTVEPKKQAWFQTCLNLETTPKKSAEASIISLTPEQIQELTENCLDSDNEPDPAEIVQSTPPRNSSTLGPKKNLFDKPHVKISNSVRYRASKYFGSGTSSEDVSEILSQENGLQSRNVSPSKSPSPKKRRLSKHSPIRLLPSHRQMGISPVKRSPGKINSVLSSPSKRSPSKMRVGSQSPKSSPNSKGLSNTTGSPNKQVEMIAEGPYYYEAFCFMIKKIHDNLEYKHLFLETELKKMIQVNTAKSEFQLYVRLLNRKDKWNRCSDIAYGDIAMDLSPLFDFLKQHELISCDLRDEKLEGLLHLLKKDELKTLCKDFKVKQTGTKSDLVNALLAMRKHQPTLNGFSPLENRVKALLGRCVRLTVNWRRVYRRCILLFSMFHSFEDLDGLGSEQALLLLQVKLQNVFFPVQDAKIIQGTRIFNSRDQFIRFEEANELRQEMHTALSVKNLRAVIELSGKVLRQFSTLLELASETNHVLLLPPFLQRYSAGSVYARILTTAIDALKQAQEYKFAMEVLNLLLSQNVYCLRLKGEWSLKQATLYHVNLKDIVKACNILCNALRDEELSSVDRMHLQERAEKVYKLKKNGLSKQYKALLQQVMNPPCKAPDVVEISARAMHGSKPGLKKVYIRDTGDGKEFMSVEETVIAHYKSLGFACGIHDEGSTVSSLCLLSLWTYIYDTSVPSVFQSPYQIKPLDWASRAFYESRKDSIESHFSCLLTKSVAVVANDLCELRSKHCHLTSLVNWDRLEHLDIRLKNVAGSLKPLPGTLDILWQHQLLLPAKFILCVMLDAECCKSFLDCVTLSLFVAISRRLLEDWKSHRKGFPDLVIWSPVQRQCLFIEVKSPNDTLSTVQSMWLKFLKKCNAKAFVVHIRESGSKGQVPAI